MAILLDLCTHMKHIYLYVSKNKNFSTIYIKFKFVAYRLHIAFREKFVVHFIIVSVQMHYVEKPRVVP